MSSRNKLLHRRWTALRRFRLPAFAASILIGSAIGLAVPAAAGPLTVTGRAVAPNASFVNLLYLDLLQRSADVPGRTYWVDQLDRGAVTPAQVAQAILSSTEYRQKLIHGLYMTYLGRPADSTSLTTFVSLLASGGTSAQVKAAILGSDEYFATRGGGTDSGWLDALYRALLNRTPSTSERSFWLTQAAADGRSSTVGAILASTEAYSRLISAWFPQLLRRPAGTTDLSYWIPQMVGGARDETVIAALVGSDEYFRANTRLHQNTPFTAVLASFTDASPNAGVSNYKVAIDWGDGSTSYGTVRANGAKTFLVTGSHTYSPGAATDTPYTVAVRISDADGSFSSTTDAATVSGLRTPGLWWQNQSTGAFAFWLMSGATRIGGGLIFQAGDTNWRIVGTPDLNGDGWQDILWQHRMTGAVIYWLMAGTNRYDGGSLHGGGDANWLVVAAGDVNGDGQADLLWQNQATGAVAYWLLNGAGRVGGGLLLPNGDTNWKIAGLGDLDGDGRLDLFWQNRATGAVAYWLINGMTRTGGGLILASGDTDWRVRVVGDVNGDGHPDLLWQNQGSGMTAYWLLNGAARAGGDILVTVGDPNWQIVGMR